MEADRKVNHSGQTLLDVSAKVKDSDVKILTVRFEKSNLKIEKPSVNRGRNR